MVQGWRGIWSVQGQESVRLFRLRTGSAGLMENKRCRKMRSDSRVGEDVAHFLVGCG